MIYSPSWEKGRGEFSFVHSLHVSQGSGQYDHCKVSVQTALMSLFPECISVAENAYLIERLNIDTFTTMSKFSTEMTV
jgi:hypothetical protein